MQSVGKMGIKSKSFVTEKLSTADADTELDLYQIIKDEAPDAIKTGEIKNQFGRKVAIVRFRHSSHCLQN